MKGFFFHPAPLLYFPFSLLINRVIWTIDSNGTIQVLKHGSQGYDEMRSYFPQNQTVYGALRIFITLTQASNETKGEIVTFMNVHPDTPDNNQQALLRINDSLKKLLQQGTIFIESFDHNVLMNVAMRLLMKGISYSKIQWANNFFFPEK